jgi:hypothetical protein
MSVQIVMDHSGDSRFTFDPADQAAVAQAIERFNELTGRGYTAAVRTGSGTVAEVTAFDPTAAETLFKPRIIGG